MNPAAKIPSIRRVLPELAFLKDSRTAVEI
jgi:hypothetical protein